MRPSSRLAAALLVILLASPGGSARIAAHAALARAPAIGSIPAPVAELARRLGIHGRAVVGDQPRGAGRPWVIWYPRLIRPGSVGPANVPHCAAYPSGPALFSGPRGARGEFHFFDASPLTRFGGDPYRGPPLTATRAMQIALQWLQHAQVPIPRAPMHTVVRTGTTDIGGTGLCCFKSLAFIYWGKARPVLAEAPSLLLGMYVADGGTVVQADKGAVPAAENPLVPVRRIDSIAMVSCWDRGAFPIPPRPGGSSSRRSAAMMAGCSIRIRWRCFPCTRSPAISGRFDGSRSPPPARCSG
jgi:hypothetical protein